MFTKFFGLSDEETLPLLEKIYEEKVDTGAALQMIEDAKERRYLMLTLMSLATSAYVYALCLYMSSSLLSK